MNHDAQKNRRIALGALALALAAGAVGPWVSVFGVLSVGPTANTEMTAIVFGGIALLSLSAVTGRGLRAASISIGVLALGEGVWVLAKLSELKADNEFGALVQPGWGLWLTVVAAVALIVSTFVVKRLPAPAAPIVEPTTSVAPPVVGG